MLGIDTDKYKYPLGSGRVTFNNNRSYMKAVSAAFIEIKTTFVKKVQVDPYLEDSLCSACGVQHGPYYCRELSCFRFENFIKFLLYKKRLLKQSNIVFYFWMVLHDLYNPNHY